MQHLNHAWQVLGIATRRAGRMTRSRIFRIAFAVLLALYPVVIYFGLRVVPAGFFGLLLALLLLVRFGLLRFGERATVAPLTFLLLYALLAIAGGQRMLLLYPVVANFTMALVFALSLWRGRPLLLRFAEARGMTMSAYSESYLYKLTAVWAVFLAANAGVALWTTTRSFEFWALYNGLLSYLLIACLLGGEVLFRSAYKRRMGIVDG